MKIGLAALVVLSSSFASAQESEFQHKMQEDLDYYKAQLVNNCGVTDKIAISYAGKLGSNPREAKGNDWAVSTVCGMGLDAMVYSCQTSAPVKKVLSHLTNVVCTAGTGRISYKIRGSDMTIAVDVKDRHPGEANSPKEDLVAKLKKDLDR
jgi:predicted benzoate:H+ symporter BenE